MMGRVYSKISRYLTSKKRKGGIVMSLQPRALWLGRLTKVDRAERKVPTCANIEHRPSLQTASTFFFFILIPHQTFSFLPKSEPYLLYPPFHSFWLDHQRWKVYQSADLHRLLCLPPAVSTFRLFLEAVCSISTLPTHSLLQLTSTSYISDFGVLQSSNLYHNLASHLLILR